jgi:hypothetical protein
MKIQLVILIMLGSLFASGEPGDARDRLEAVTGPDQHSAHKLLMVIRVQPIEKVRAEMSELVKHQKYHLVSIALTDSSDSVKLEAAISLATVKRKSVAVALFDASKDLEIAVRGGTEADALRARTKQAFENSLSLVTGVLVDQAWSKERKLKEFRDAIAKLPE